MFGGKRTITLLLILPVSAAALAGNPVDLADWLEPHRRQQQLPALGAVVADSETVVALGVSGRRSAAHDTSVHIDDQWHLGSITKSMLATIAARLIDRNLLQFSSTFEELLDAQFPESHPEWSDVRLDDLLQHRGGLTDDLTGLDVWRTMDTGEVSPVEQRQRMLAELLREAPRHAPGSASLYSNAGYVLVGMMLEAASEQTWENLLVHELFRPLGLSSAGIGSPGQAVEPPDQPRGHRLEAGAVRPVEPGLFADHPPALAPAGTVHMNLQDLATYLQAHLRGLRGMQDGFLPPELFQRLHQPGDHPLYALGWFVGPAAWSRGTVSAHEGSNTFWLALAWLSPEEDTVLAIVSNHVPEDQDALIGIALDLVDSRNADW